MPLALPGFFLMSASTVCFCSLSPFRSFLVSLRKAATHPSAFVLCEPAGRFGLRLTSLICLRQAPAFNLVTSCGAPGAVTVFASSGQKHAPAPGFHMCASCASRSSPLPAAHPRSTRSGSRLPVSASAIALFVPHFGFLHPRSPPFSRRRFFLRAFHRKSTAGLITGRCIKRKLQKGKQR
jgi:hypothetical protein